MAIIKCEECSKEYSSTLAACPHCGYIKNMRQQQIAAGQILQDRRKKNSCITTIFLFLVIGVIVFIVGMVACNSVIMPQSADLIKGRILSESANL